jgi:phenylacetaldehyde dehydrogenase
LTRVASAEEAVQMANDSPYGLAASIWSNEIGGVLELIPRLRTGMVWVNHHMIGATEGAHSATKQSGTGVDLSSAALEAFTVPRSVQVRHSRKIAEGLL